MSGARGEGDRRLGVLGTLVLDTIRGAGGDEVVEAPGGVTYALAAFEARPAEGWATVPLVKVGEGARALAEDLAGSMGTVASREGLVGVSAPNNRVELVYGDDGERSERLSGGVPGWAWDELQPLLEGCDALYVNLVAGWELDLPTARRLREGFSGPTYCDLHSLFLDRGGAGPRRRRVPDDWRGWFACFDHLQVNRAELTALARRAGEDPWALADGIADAGPRALFVTLGAEGAAWTSGAAGAPPGSAPGREEAASAPGTERGREAPPRRVVGGDPTGCGDVWGMACFSALLEGAGFRAAVRRANRLACANAACSGGLGLVDSGAARPGPSGRGEGRRADPRGAADLDGGGGR